MPTKKIVIESLPGVRLSWAGTSVDVALFGAHICSWKTPGTAGQPVERLWMSSLAHMDGSAPIRGGIPIVWPQFANDGPHPLHGFARELPWVVVSAADDNDQASASITLELTDSQSTRDGSYQEPSVEPFPWKFRLRFTITLGAGHLQLRLEARNEASVEASKMAFTACIHTYFRTADSTQVRLSKGLKGAPFIDKVDGMSSKIHGGADTPLHTSPELADSLELDKAATESKGFVDRIYTASGVSQQLSVGRGLDPADAEGTSTYELHQVCSVR